MTDAGFPSAKGGALTFLRSAAFRYRVGAVLGAVLIYASLDKIWKPAEFARIVYPISSSDPAPPFP